MKAILVLSVLLMAVGCAKSDSAVAPDAPAPGGGQGQNLAGSSSTPFGFPAAVLCDDGLVLAADRIQGSGRIIFASPMENLPLSKQFKVGVDLEDGGSLSLIAFADDGLEQGVAVGVERSDARLKASVGQVEVPDAPALFKNAGINVDGSLEFVIEIGAAGGAQAPYVAFRTPDAAKVIWDSRDAVAPLSPGQGLRWGVDLRRASLTGLVVTELEDPSDKVDDDDPAVPTDFSVADLLETARKATTRFNRLAIPNSEIKSIKTWKAESYTWAKLVYAVTKEDGQVAEGFIFLACHYHGAFLGCHSKDASDPSEPGTSAVDSERL